MTGLYDIEFSASYGTTPNSLLSIGFNKGSGQFDFIQGPQFTGGGGNVSVFEAQLTLRGLYWLNAGDYVYVSIGGVGSTMLSGTAGASRLLNHEGLLTWAIYRPIRD